MHLYCIRIGHLMPNDFILLDPDYSPTFKGAVLAVLHDMLSGWQCC